MKMIRPEAIQALEDLKATILYIKNLKPGEKLGLADQYKISEVSDSIRKLTPDEANQVNEDYRNWLVETGLGKEFEMRKKEIDNRVGV